MTAARPSPRGSGRPHRLGARDAAAAIAAGRLTSRALVEDCLARIAEREDVVKAWTHLDAETALQRADELDQHRRSAQGAGRDAARSLGPLHGVPMGLKDVIDAQGLPCGCGSPIHAQRRPEVDAGAVAMARAAGAVILGKTVTTEFAASQPGPTTNPHDPAHTPGGSSSGSAAAVADFMVPLALGTQTGGSIIRPASFCGIVGFKPSFGLINRYGVKQLADSFDTVGTFARSVGDTGLAVAATTGRRDFLDIPQAKPRHVVACRTDDWREAETASLDATAAALQRLSEAGIRVSEVRLPALFDGMAQAHRTIEYFELARALQHEYRCHRDRLSDVIRTRVETGLACEPQAYEAALALTQRCRSWVAESLFGEADLIVTPSAPGEAPRGLGSTGKAVFNRLWSALGVPCITLPTGSGPGGLPIGVQFIGPARMDARLLAHAAWIESLLSRSGRPSP